MKMSMRRWGLLFACLSLMVLTSRVLAIGEVIEDLEDVATAMPDDTAFYFVLRTDEQVLGDLNALVNRVTDKLSVLGIPSVDLEEELRRLLDEQSIDYDQLREGVGDFVSMSMTADAADYFMNNPNNTEFPEGARIYIQVRDRSVIETFVGSLASPQREGSYTLYRIGSGVTFALNNEWLILMGDRRVPDANDSLAETPEYEALEDKLPGSNYGALMYMTADILAMTVTGTPNDLRELTAQYALFGFALDDERHLILDYVQTMPEGNPVAEALPTTPVDSEFLRYVPEDTDLLVQMNNVAGYVDYFDVYMESFAPGTNVRRELENALRSVNLDLEDDLLSWMDGEALLYSSFDLEVLMESSSDGSFDSIPFEFGLVLETSDTEASQRFFDVLETELGKVRSSELRVGSATINDVEVTTIRVDIPNGTRSLGYEIMMGVTDEVAFIASADVAQFITVGRGDSILDNPAYAEAAALYVPNTKQVLYASDEGIMTIGAGIAAIFLLGNEFEMPMPGLPISQMPSPYIAYQPGSSTFILDMLRDILHSASITSSLEEGFQTTRLVFSLD